MRITIESKYNIGDQVYVISSYCGRITKTTIVDVKFSNGKFLYTTEEFPKILLEEYELEVL